jgi:hypothetical protein
MYPRDFFANVKSPPKAGSCFVVMPFAKRFDGVFRLIKATLERDLRLTCIRADDVLGGGNIIQDVLRGMAESELIVVDVRNRNPNVFYELGIAHMCKPVEKVLLLSQDQASIPFDLRPFRHIVYKDTREGLTALSKELIRAVQAVQSKVYRLVLSEEARGILYDEIMGKDYAVYKFEALGGGIGRDWVKVSLRVVRSGLEGKSTELAGLEQRRGRPAPSNRP